MSTDEVYIETEEARKAVNTVSGAGKSLSGSAQEASSLSSEQPEGKWGVEAGATSFKSAYVARLISANDDFNLTEERLKAFVEGARKAIDRFTDVDQDVEAANLLAQARLERREKEDKRKAGQAPSSSQEPVVLPNQSPK